MTADLAVGTGMKITCSRDDLAARLGIVSRGLSTRGTVQILAGVLLQVQNGTLELAATDMELSLRTKLEASVEGEGSAVVPGRLLTDIVFGVDDTWLTTRRIDGQFPSYKQLLPEAFEHEVKLPREEFLDVIRRAGVMAQRSTPLRLRFAEGELTVSAQTQDIGEAREQMPIGFSGEALEIGFNPLWLKDGIESVIEDELTLKLINPLRPAVIAESGGDFWYLIMPIRLAG